MKRYLFVFSTLASLLLTGCGGGSDSNSDNGETTMETGKTYTVFPGDTLVKNAPDTVVKITHTQGHEESVVELVAGSASIIRK